jgi:riboflavin synthase
MFTGLVQSLAEVVDVIDEPPGVRLVIHEPKIAAVAQIGDSIAINGCCLTVVGVDGDRFSFQAGEETLSRTNLGELIRGSFVNLEQSLKAGDAIGGHYVTGHIDAVGTVDERKGSVAVDGISLTLVNVENERFSVALIPHTLAMTTLGRRQVGDRVNIETDVLAKYVERQLHGTGH